MNDEIWKAVKGVEGLYEVSSIGRIRTSSRIVIAKDGRRMIIPSRIRLQSTDWHGYCYVKIYKNKKQHSLRVHRAVAEAFIDNPETKPFVDHINTIKTDNRIENLRWVTAHENTQNEITLQRIKDACTPEEIQRQRQVKITNGTYNGKKVFQYTKEGEFVAEYETVFAASKMCGIPDANICKALDNPTKSVGGFLWMTKKEENVVWRRNVHHGKRAIQQIGAGGAVVKEWNSMKDACNELGINRHGLGYSLMYRDGQYKNMQFRYKDSTR